ncbi:hypothetical protein PO909_030123, partial [Leuciscus waleckii]
LSIVSLNARGLRQICKRKALFLFAKQLRCFFQESHSTSADINFWKSQWGNDIWFSQGSERSAGVTSLKHTFSGDILHSDCDSLGHYVCLVIRVDNIFSIIINIYGYNNKLENDKLLDSIEERITFWLTRYPNSLLLIGGDFNIAQDNAIDRLPPGRPSSMGTNLKRLMSRFNIVDIWREKFPDDRSFTWSNRSGSSQSRIDFWLLSSNIDKEKVTVNILATPLTDHRAIHINTQFSASNTFHRSCYWKLNNSLLKHEKVKAEMIMLITRFYNKAKKEKSYNTNWELLKFELGKFLRQYGTAIAKAKRAEEDEVINTISSFYQRPPEEVSEEDRLLLLQLQNKLKAEGAFVRSRKRWLEEGEQNFAYFFRLERYRSKINSIYNLNINGVVTDDAKLISDFCSKFYSNLYSSKYNKEVTSHFLNSINNVK